MGNRLRQLKYLPWLALAQAAALAVFLVVVLDVLLQLAYGRSEIVRQVLEILFGQPLGLLTSLLIAVGIGALGVYVLEKLNSSLRITAGILWAMVLCLMLAQAFKSLLPPPTVLLGLNQTNFIGIMLGVFWRGRRYWR